MFSNFSFRNPVLNRLYLPMTSGLQSMTHVRRIIATESHVRQDEILVAHDGLLITAVCGVRSQTLACTGSSTYSVPAISFNVSEPVKLLSQRPATPVTSANPITVPSAYIALRLLRQAV